METKLILVPILCFLPGMVARAASDTSSYSLYMETACVDHADRHYPQPVSFITIHSHFATRLYANVRDPYGNLVGPSPAIAWIENPCVRMEIGDSACAEVLITAQATCHGSQIVFYDVGYLFADTVEIETRLWTAVQNGNRRSNKNTAFAQAAETFDFLGRRISGHPQRTGITVRIAAPGSANDRIPRLQIGSIDR
jgi:hypothetical protein